jgi:hypothetical protein
MIPQKPGQTPEDRDKDIDNVLTWLRSDGVDLTKDYSPEAFKKLGEWSHVDCTIYCTNF